MIYAFKSGNDIDASSVARVMLESTWICNTLVCHLCKQQVVSRIWLALALVGAMHNPADVRVHLIAVVGPYGIEMGGAC